MTKNAELAYRGLDVAMVYEKHFEMREWVTGRNALGELIVSLADLVEPACGTTACLAGWIAVLLGCSVTNAGQVYRAGAQYEGSEGIRMWARPQLGIGRIESDELFLECGNDQVGMEVERIFGPRRGYLHPSYDPRHWTTYDGHKHVSIPAPVPVKWERTREGENMVYTSAPYRIVGKPYGAFRRTYEIRRDGLELPILFGGGLAQAKARAVQNARGHDVVNVA